MNWLVWFEKDNRWLAKDNSQKVNSGIIRGRQRPARDDIVQQFKLINGINEVSCANFQVHSSSLSQSGSTRGIRNTRRLSGQVTTKCTRRANSFTNRVFNQWNALPSAVVTDSDSVDQFKNRYDAFMTGH
ncbi:RNA-directed DNA polymerase from mobile element jockey-like [Brachionus plicatilis]|uniref:RNA-directed DNA polymerase from mobile element jockey-like n=1 Tax=Brachionus plicatilis TaxID=10195 RepID=A0A3M7R5M6_BRAPC|nr:RNA-directed DNA polymerase from mobile element jockey-like [Brachionus plicatilis]